MKTYANPEIEVVEIAVEDVITASTDPVNPGCQYETGDRD